MHHFNISDYDITRDILSIYLFHFFDFTTVVEKNIEMRGEVWYMWKMYKNVRNKR